jgi:hemimethylated DNA binding protein
MREHIFNEYAVGMVVFLQRDPDGYRLGNGVIIDWDDYCAREHMWQENIGKFDLKRPFYSILKEDGTEIYISEGKDFNKIL